MTLILKETKTTPEINFNPDSNEWTISGRSYSTDPSLIYQPILRWLLLCEEKAISSCTLTFKLDFFDTASFKTIFDMLERLKDLKQKEIVKSKVNWYYEEEDEQMLDSGESLKLVSQIPFEMISYCE